MRYKSMITSMIALFLFGCSALSIGGNKNQDALLKFINEDVQEVSEHQEKYALVFNEILMDISIDEETFLETLENEAIPEAEKAVEVVDTIEFDMEELEDPYSYLKDAINYYLESLNLFAELVKTEDLDVEAEADEAFEN